MAKRIIIAGSGFAGMAAAKHLRQLLPKHVELVVLSKDSEFVFQPSLIWVPFGLRDAANISLPLDRLYARTRIHFKECEIKKFLPAQSCVETSCGTMEYDYVLLATGPEMDYSTPGMGPHTGYTQSIYSLPEALLARKAYVEFLKNPGPVVIGSGQGASCYGAAYEFLFNFAYQMRLQGLAHDVPITFVTSEPYLGHFGVGGFGKAPKLIERYLQQLGIQAILNACISKVTDGHIHLCCGGTIPFIFAMLTPRFTSVKPVVESGLANEDGWVEVDDYYQHKQFPNIYAAGATVAVKPRESTPVPCEFPKTGHMSEVMAKLAAFNIAAALNGGQPVGMKPECINAMCIVDGGNTGIMMFGNEHYQSPETNTWIIPGPHAHWAKLAFERFYILSKRLGFT